MAASAAKADDLPEEGQAAPKGSKKKLILFAAIGLLVLGAAGGGYMFWQKGKSAAAENSGMKKKMVFMDLPELTTNLATQPGQERPVYLKLKVALEIEVQPGICRTGLKAGIRRIAGFAKRLGPLVGQIVLRCIRGFSHELFSAELLNSTPTRQNRDLRHLQTRRY